MKQLNNYRKDEIIHGDALEVLKTLPDKSIDMCMTSPPYWALRDYGVDGQLGLEKTFGEYINNLCDIFDEVKKVLRDEGTCWVNLGDCYAGNMGKKSGWTDNKLGFEREEAIEKGVCLTNKIRIEHQLPQKCLVGIPMRFAIEMINRGWILRNTIIWHKPNCMPSSVKDRFTVNFEYIFFFVKNKKYWFKTQYEPQKTDEYKTTATIKEYKGNYKGGEITSNEKGKSPLAHYKNGEYVNGFYNSNGLGRNKRAVWTITTKPFKEAHFATYPEKLCEVPIKAGCPKGGIVLDPFFGAGTTGLVAKQQGRNYLGIELNPKYIEIAQARINKHKL
jgi:DNA modification methylase